MSVVIREGEIQKLQENQAVLLKLLTAQNEAIKSLSSSMAKMIETDTKNMEAIEALADKMLVISEVVRSSAKPPL